MRKLQLKLWLFTLLVAVGGVESVKAQIVSGTTYYLQNKASGRFISSGHGWFTRSTLSPVLDYPIQPTSSDGKYILKVVGSKQLGHNLFVDNGDNNTWTITAVAGEENVYTIANGSNYLGYDGSLVLSASLTDATKDAAKWYIRTKDDYLTMFASASAENPVDASFYITGPSYDYTDTNRNNAWTMSGFGASTELSRGSGTTAINPYVVEIYNNTGSIKQTLTGLKKGMYGVSVYGFYRAGNNTTAPAARDAGTEAQNAIMYAGTKEKALKSVYDEAQPNSVAGMFTTSTSYGYVPNARSTAGECFANGYYKNTIYIYIDADDSSLEIGVKKDAKINEDWAVIDNWSMTYYGSEELSETEIVLASAVKAYRTALANAQSYQDKNMFSADLTTLNAAISANTIDMEGTVTEEMLTTATANLNAAAAVAAKAVVKKTAFDNIVADTEGKTDVNITSRIANLGFEDGNLNGWTTDNGGGVASNNNFTGKVGTWFVERWQNGVALGSGSLTHDVITLPKGVYTITANAQNIEQYNSSAAGTGYFFCVNDTRKEIGAAGTYTNVVKYTAQTDVTLKFLLEDCTGNWISCDNIQIVYNGEDFPAVTLVEGKMNATVAAAQTAAKDAYDANPTVANYNTLVDAIAAAQASKAAYEHLGAAITKIDAALAAATTATVTDDEAYQTIKTAYNDGTIENANIQTNINNAYNAVIAIIKSQTATSADFTLAIKNQSFEYGDMTGWTATASSDTGVRETSNATYAATGTDGYYLFNTWWQGVPLTQAVTNLPNGQYTLTASVSSDGATIYLIANGEHNDGIETGGDKYPSSNVMQETTFTFLVKDGTATIGVVGGANGTAGEHKDYVAEGYWWYKADNFRLVKNRDLTPEEAAIVPEDLSIPSTATVFINKTTTLVPTSTTEDASIEGFVNWTSDNTSVATVSSTGVVTPVSYGTANITVTSTLNAQATATCAVTVTAPLYNEAENLDFAEGPVIDNHICTYKADMTKPENNTTYCRTQPVTGWTITSTDTDGKAAGVMTYASSTGMGNNSVCAPATNPDGETTGNVFGMVGVWSNGVQYVQPVKLPAGKYTITVPIYRNGGATALTKNLIGFVEDSGTEHFATTTVYADKTWTTETIEFNVDEETYGKLSLGLNSPNKGSGDCQRLWIDRMTIAYEPFATAADYAALNTAIEAKDGKTLGFDEGEYAPYNNAAVLLALAAAKAIDQEANNVQSTVQAATAALAAASWSDANTEEVNAVYDGTFAAATNNGAPAGWRMSNNTLGGDLHSRAFVGDDRLAEFNGTKSGLFLRFDGTNSNRGSMYYYGDTEGYTMPLDADTYYRVTVDFAGWGSTGKPLQMNVTGPEGFTTVSQQYTTSVRADNADNAPQQFNIMFKTAGAGNYVINFQTPGADSNTHNVVISNVVLKKALENITIAEGETYTPALKYANVTFNRTLVQGWNGLVLPFDMTVENVVTTFNASKVKNFTGITYDPAKGVTLNFADFAAETVISAGTPFLVKTNADGTSYTINGVVLPATGLKNITKTAEDNDKIKYTMKGTHAASTDLTNVSFALIQGNTFFYHDGAAPKASSAKAFRAYFENESTKPEGARVSFDFGDGETTGITELAQPKTAADGTYYDLQGRKVETFKQKGIYIVNGRKVVK